MFDFSLKDKCIVVSGAGYGLGRALAIAFSRYGSDLVLLGRDRKNLETTASLLKTKHLVLQADLSIAKEVELSCQKIIHEFPHIDILINNAAGWLKGSFEDHQPEEIEQVLNSTLLSTIFLTRSLLPALQKSSSPHIVNVLSTAAMPRRDLDIASSSLPYFAAKWGQAGFSEALRAYAKKIKVSSFYPGTFDTDSNLDDTEGKKGMVVRDVVEGIIFCVSRSKSACVQSLVLAETEF